MNGNKMVFIFTWFNAKPAHVAKYKNLYVKMGVPEKNVKIFTSNPWFSCNYSKWLQHRKLICMQNRPHDLIDTPDIVHLCSGGIFNFHNIFCTLNRCDGHPGRDWIPKCVVYDSGLLLPCSTQLCGYLKDQLPPLKAVPNGLMVSVLNAYFFLHGATPRVLEKERQQILKTLDGSRFPILFLNGSEDRLVVPPSRLYDATGLHQHVFKNGQHMSIYKTHAQEYENVLKNFFMANNII